MSPTTRIPVPMMESPASPSGAPCPFSVKIAMSVLLVHDREGIERLATAADFEMEVGRRRASRVARQGDHLARGDRVPLPHQEARRVSTHRLISAAVPQEDKQAVAALPAGRLHDAAPPCAPRRAERG